MSRVKPEEVENDLSHIDFDLARDALKSLKKVERPGAKTLVVRQLHDSIIEAKKNGATNEQIADVLTKTTHLEFTKTSLQNILGNIHRLEKVKTPENDIRF
jgi:CHAD domain-containing protein